MALIFLVTASGEQSQHEEAELSDMIGSGLISHGSSYWKEGMSDWRPIEELMPGGAAGGSVWNQAVPGNQGYRFTKDPRGITRFLLVMFGLSLLSEIVLLWSNMSQLRMLESEFTQQQAEENDARQGLLGMAYIAIYLVNAVTFLMWIHRTNRNCRGFGTVGMVYTPGWCVGYFFIPILNWFRPYQAMKEIWQVSENPHNWQSVKPSGLLGFWWFFWVLNGLLGQVMVQFQASSSKATISASDQT